MGTHETAVFSNVSLFPDDSTHSEKTLSLHQMFLFSRNSNRNIYDSCNILYLHGNPRISSFDTGHRNICIECPDCFLHGLPAFPDMPGIRVPFSVHFRDTAPGRSIHRIFLLSAGSRTVFRASLKRMISSAMSMHILYNKSQRIFHHEKLF